MNNILRSQIVKRAVDIAGAVFGLTVFSPLLIPVCVLIRLDGANGIFFKQERIGKHGKRFMLYKFTTMQDDAHVKGPLLSKTDDLRITRVGKIVRMLSLNELAQFINVLKGQMSIVGPRPLLMQYLKRYTPEQARRHAVKQACRRSGTLSR